VQNWLVGQFIIRTPIKDEKCKVQVQ